MDLVADVENGLDVGDCGVGNALEPAVFERDLDRGLSAPPWLAKMGAEYHV
jgi:hypothetical protein